MRQLFILITAMIVILSATACTKDTPAATNPGNGQPPASSNQASTPAPDGSKAPGATAPGTTTPGTTEPVTTPGMTSPPKADSSKPAPPVEAPKGAKEQPVATVTQFEKVQYGMSYDDVTKAMGAIGKLTSESKDADGSNAIQTYEYKTKEGGTLKVTFKDGKVLNTSSSTR
jgi:hypothetical protein